MKVAFPCFGKDSDYLQFTIADLVELERVMGVSVYKLLANDDFGAMFVFRAVPIAYRHCNPTMTEEEVRDNIQRYIDEGGNLAAIIGLAVMALMKSGIAIQPPTESRGDNTGKKSGRLRNGSPAQSRWRTGR